MPETILRIDRARCIGAENCVRTAPATFGIGDDDIVTRLPPPNDDPARIAEAVASCPVRALSLDTSNAQQARTP